MKILVLNEEVPVETLYKLADSMMRQKYGKSNVEAKDIVVFRGSMNKEFHLYKEIDSHPSFYREPHDLDIDISEINSTKEELNNFIKDTIDTFNRLYKFNYGYRIHFIPDKRDRNNPDRIIYSKVSIFDLDSRRPNIPVTGIDIFMKLHKKIIFSDTPYGKFPGISEYEQTVHYIETITSKDIDEGREKDFYSLYEYMAKYSFVFKDLVLHMMNSRLSSHLDSMMKIFRNNSSILRKYFIDYNLKSKYSIKFNIIFDRVTLFLEPLSKKIKKPDLMTDKRIWSSNNFIWQIISNEYLNLIK